MDNPGLIAAIITGVIFAPIIVAVVVYIVAVERHNRWARKQGWICVGGSFVTGPIYSPPPPHGVRDSGEAQP